MVPSGSDALHGDFGSHPSEQELILSYLRPRVASGGERTWDFIHDADVYAADPADLTKEFRPAIASDGEKAWYFFTPLRSKSRRGQRKARTVGAGEGCWHSEHAAKVVLAGIRRNLQIGRRQSFSFVRKEDGQRVRSGWLMVEICLNHGKEEDSADEIVLCKVYPSPRSAPARGVKKSTAGAAAAAGRKRKADGKNSGAARHVRLCSRCRTEAAESQSDTADDAVKEAESQSEAAESESGVPEDDSMESSAETLSLFDVEVALWGLESFSTMDSMGFAVMPGCDPLVIRDQPRTDDRSTGKTPTGEGAENTPAAGNKADAAAGVEPEVGLSPPGEEARNEIAPDGVLEGPCPNDPTAAVGSTAPGTSGSRPTEYFRATFEGRVTQVINSIAQGLQGLQTHADALRVFLDVVEVREATRSRLAEALQAERDEAVQKAAIDSNEIIGLRKVVKTFEASHKSELEWAIAFERDHAYKAVEEERARSAKALEAERVKAEELRTAVADQAATTIQKLKEKVSWESKTAKSALSQLQEERHRVAETTAVALRLHGKLLTLGAKIVELEQEKLTREMTDL